MHLLMSYLIVMSHTISLNMKLRDLTVTANRTIKIKTQNALVAMIIHDFLDKYYMLSFTQVFEHFLSQLIFISVLIVITILYNT